MKRPPGSILALALLFAFLLPAGPAAAQPWTPAQLTASDGAGNDLFGYSVAISGDTAVVGAVFDDVGTNGDQGSAYIFVRSGTTWTQQAKLTAADGANGDFFGASVAISGDTVIAGAMADAVGPNFGQGSAYIFVRSGTTWTQQAKLTAADGAAGDSFGNSVAISANTAVIGSQWDDAGANIDQGSAYVFVRSGTSWTQQSKLTAPDGAANDEFGISVAVVNDTAMVGAYFDTVGANGRQGSAHVFVRSGTVWTHQAQLTASDGVSEDFFGASVSLSGETALVGAYANDVGANANQGAAYCFIRSGTSWTQQAKLTASDGSASDLFGYSVSIDGDRAVVGAQDDDVGPNSNQGSAYIFTRTGTTWTEQTRWADSYGAPVDTFGASVGISGATAVVGAFRDDLGANLNQGSAWIYQPSAGTGTCCVPNGTCSVRSEPQCAAMGGIYLGDGTGSLCSPDHHPCAPPGGGACCRDYGVCVLVESEAFCQPPHIYAGDGSTCLPDPCPGSNPTMACCLSDQSCMDLSGGYCESLGGSPGAVGSTCATTTCPPYEACCLYGGACVARTPFACVNNLAGTPQGPGSICPETTCPLPGPAITLNEIRIDQPSNSRNKSIADQDEYFELAGPPAASLNGYWYIVIGDGPRTLVNGQPRGGSGVIEAVVNLAGKSIASGGFFLAAEDAQMPQPGVSVDWVIGADGLNFENNDNVTHLLVKGFSGQIGQDLDFNDDGTLDLAPWTSIEDCVAVVEKPDPDHFGDKVYCATRVGPVVSGNRTFSPGHVYRDATRAGSFQAGQFTFDVKSSDTPGYSNTPQTGACCNGGTCTPNLTKSACESGSGTWAGAGTTCSPSPCVGACCLANGDCAPLTEAACKANADNTFRGAGTDCMSFDCNCDGQRSFGPRLVINEVWAGNPGVDSSEFLEVTANACGAHATQLMGGTSIVMVDGDCPGGALLCLNFKRLTFRYDFGPFESIPIGGQFVIGHLGGLLRGTVDRELPVGSIENGSQTYAIVRTQDLAFCFDPANPTVAPPGCQGIIDSHRLTDASVAAITAHLIDAVATTDADAGDFVYFGAPVVKSGVHQASYMQRKVDGQDTNTAADWDTQWGVELGDPGDVASPGGSNVTATGACCTAGGCTSAVLRSTCENTLGGVYQGNGSTCSPDPCVGACCVGGSCTSGLSPTACAAAGGAFMGRGTPCAAVNCAGISIAEAKALPLGSPVILDQLVVISKNDVISHASTKCFQVRRGSDGATITGLNAYMDTILNQVNVGDTLSIAGTTGEFLGLFELTNDVAPFKVLGTFTGGGSIDVVTLTAADLQDGSAVAEANESRIVRLDCMSFVDGGTGVFEGDKSYLATDGTQIVRVFIPATAAGLLGTTIPVGARDLRGILWQADHENLPPAVMNKGYRLTIRSSADLLATVTCGAATVGACCAPAGTCSCGVTTQANCVAAGGTYFGDGTTCTPSTLCDSNRLRGDIEGDVDVDLIDMQLFVLAILGDPDSIAHVARSDLNCSGAADGADISPMADLLVP